MQVSVILAGAPWGLPLNVTLLPQYLKAANRDYRTTIVASGTWGSTIALTLHPHEALTAFMATGMATLTITIIAQKHWLVGVYYWFIDMLLFIATGLCILLTQ